MDLVKIEITTPLPAEVTVDRTYKIEGIATVTEGIGPPPFLYAEIQKKDWYKPEILEETTYERGFAIPIGGSFSIKWEPAKAGKYEVIVVATPAPLSLPVIGVPPVVGRSDMMSVTTVEELGKYTELQIVSYGKAWEA